MVCPFSILKAENTELLLMGTLVITSTDLSSLVFLYLAIVNTKNK